MNQDTNTPLLKLDAVSKRYGTADSPACVRVLDELDLRVETGDSLAIVGPSGCGKSTLLNIIGGLDRPSSGSVRLDGQVLDALPDADLAALRNRAIGFIFQQHHLLPQCTVLENVLIPTLAERRSRDDRQSDTDRAHALLEQVGLADRRHHRPGQLSGGESQRVAVARALIHQPRLLLADEPTGSLDPATAGELVNLLADLHADRGVTLIVVTHSRELAARMGTVYSLAKGRIAT